MIILSIFHLKARLDSAQKAHHVAGSAMLLVSYARGEIMASNISQVINIGKLVIWHRGSAVVHLLDLLHLL